MNFLDIIKSTVYNTIQSMKFLEAYIGEVVEEEPLKIKLDEKLFITRDEIVPTSSFSGFIKIGTRLFILRDSGGQRFYILDSIIYNEEEEQRR